jgi:hypothetical protein
LGDFSPRPAKAIEWGNGMLEIKLSRKDHYERIEEEINFLRQLMRKLKDML